jgi:tryptophan halogenase
MHTLANLSRDKWHLNSEDGFLIEGNKDTLSLKNGPQAYHFDAHKVGKYFKRVCGDKVKHIDAEVLDVLLDDQGFVKTLKLNSGETVDGDFFIDATGFSRLLMKKINVGWHSYRNHLPVDRAMPFLIPYQESEMIRPLTTAWAQSSGWMWMIPTLNRKGCGYVFSSEFITEDQAHKEIEITLGRKIDPIKFIKFDSGRSDVLWSKNVMCIGLAAAFAEPLEATSIHTTIVQLENFAQFFLKRSKFDTCDIKNIDLYNEKHIFMYDLIKDFLVLHYQGGRTDSEFWRYISSGKTLTDHVSAIIEVCKHRVPTNFLFPGIAGSAGWPLWSYILAGTNKLSPEVAKKDLELHRLAKHASMEYDQLVQKTKNKISLLQDNTNAIRKRQTFNS